MFNKLKSIQQEDAFTLIELLVVILIIGILAGIAIPVFLNQQKAAINASLESDVHNTQINAVTFMTENPWASASNNVFATGPGGEKFAFATTNPTPNLVISDEKTTLAVKFFGNGNYKVEGYNPNAKKVYSYDSTTGKYSEANQGIATAVSPDKGAALGDSTSGEVSPGAGSTTPPTTPAPTATPTPTPVLLKTYTFESGSDTFSNTYTSTTMTYNSQSSNARTGSGSVYFRGTSSQESIMGGTALYVAGQKYRVTAYVKQNAGTNSYIYGGPSVKGNATTVSGTWTPIVVEFTATKAGHAIQINTEKNAGSSSSILTYVDDITVEKIS